MRKNLFIDLIKLKVEKFYRNFLGIFLLSFISHIFVYSQDISWKCSDPDFNEEFIGKYNDLFLAEFPDNLDHNISEDDELMVFLKGDYSIKEVSVADNDGILDTMYLRIINKLDSSLIEKLIKRRYSWDHINPDLVDFKLPGRNVHEYSAYKKIRDHYWWIPNKATLNPFKHSYILRPDPGIFSVMLKQGDEEIGFPSSLSRNSRIFIAIEPTNVFINIPWEPKSINFSKVHPLEKAMGGGVSFDMDKLGGMIAYNSIENLSYSEAFDPENIIYNDWSGLIYWTESNKLERKNDDPSKNIDKNLWIPSGTQRWRLGVSYSELVYGQIDSANNFTALKYQNFFDNFNLFFNWTYISKSRKHNESYSEWVKLTGYFQVNIGRYNRLNFGFLRSISSGLAVGLNFAWAQPTIYFEGQENEYIWDPGFVVSPNLTIRF